jgi:hypothetical protein
MTYGCHNRAPLGQKVIPVQDGWFTDGLTRYPKLVPLPFRMAPDCKYSETDLGKADKGCEGCKWRK